MTWTLYQNRFFKKKRFLSKIQMSCVVYTYYFDQISPACGTNNFKGDFGLSMSALETVTWKSFNGKFAENKILIGFPLLMLTSEVGSLSIHYLIRIWTTCCWNLNIIVLSELRITLSFLTKNGKPFLIKCWRHFGRRFCQLRQLFDVEFQFGDNLKTAIFQCSKTVV